MPLRAGELDRPLTLQALQAGQDAYGQPQETWVTVGQLWGRLEVLGGGEGFVAGADRRASQQTVRFTVRYRPGVAARMRVMHDGQAYDIEAVHETERRAVLLLDCRVVDVVIGGG